MTGAAQNVSTGQVQAEYGIKSITATWAYWRDLRVGAHYEVPCGVRLTESPTPFSTISKAKTLLE